MVVAIDYQLGEWHVRSLRAEVGGSITTRMKLGYELFNATQLPGRDSDSYTLAITEEVLLSF